MRELDDLQVSLDDVKRKLASFEGRQHAEILKAFQLRTRQSREIDRQLDGVATFAARVIQESETLVADDIPAGLFSPASEVDLSALALTSRLHTEVEEAGNALREAGLRLRNVAEQERLGLTRSAWSVAVFEAHTQYSQLTQELKLAGVGDPAGYGSLIQEQHRLETEIERLNALRVERDKLAQQENLQRESIRAARRELSQQRQQFLSTLASNSYVRIELLPYGRSPRS